MQVQFITEETGVMRPQETAPIPVLYVDHTAKIGGGEIALLNLVCALDHSRYEPIVVLASDGPLVRRLRDAGIETHVMPLDPAVVDTRKDSLGPRTLLQLGQAARVLGYTVRLARWAKHRRVRIIHANSLKADLYGGLAGRLARIPAIWHVRDNINGDYLPPLVAAAFRRLAHVVPQVVVANSESTLRCLQTPQAKSTAVVYSGIPGGAAGQDAASSRTQVVHDGTPVGHLAAHAPRHSALGRGPVVSLVGRITPWKGQHVFLRAAARVRKTFPEAQFWIIGSPLFGEGDYERSLHALAEELGVTDCVTFWGFREDVPALLAQTDLLVHASTLGEPFGQVVIEGMAAGKPVIATDGGALPEIVLPGETGLLVPMGDADAMADAVAVLLTDPARMAAMGAAGRRRVQEQFTIGHTVRRVEAVYAHLLGDSPRSKKAVLQIT